MIFPVLIYELYKFAADAWSFEGQFRELGNRFLYTRIPQMVAIVIPSIKKTNRFPPDILSVVRTGSVLVHNC